MTSPTAQKTNSKNSAAQTTGPEAPAAHALSADDVLDLLGTDAERGLPAKRAATLLARHGSNELAEAPPPPLWRKFFRQFRELIVLILIAAAVVAGTLGEWTDSVAILAIVLLNGVIGFV
jgi:Ca2+-transporting ATPase